MDGPRLLFPIMPFFLAYAFTGANSIPEILGPYVKRIPLVMVCIMLIIYVPRYEDMEYGPMKDGVMKKQSVELFNFIKNNTGADEVIIFNKPRAMALFGGRKTSVYSQTKDDKVLRFYFGAIGASYIVVSRTFSSDMKFLYPFVVKYRPFLEPVFSNGDFIVFKIDKAKLYGGAE